MSLLTAKIPNLFYLCKARFFVAVLMVACLTASAEANIFLKDGHDPRVALDRTSSEGRRFAPIGVLRNLYPINVTNKNVRRTGLGRATVFMISPCFAMTAHHAIFGDNSNPDPKGIYTVSVEIGISDDGKFKHFINARPVKWANIQENPGQDWAILKLDQCIGAEIGWLNIIPPRHKYTANKITVSTAGFPADIPLPRIAFESNCSIEGYNLGGDYYFTSCSSRPGASGSPLLFSIDGDFYVYGIISDENRSSPKGLEKYTNEQATLATTTTFLLLYPEISSVIARDSARIHKD